jgi:hypothetical protein
VAFKFTRGVRYRGIQFSIMRVSILYIVTFAIFSRIADLSRIPRTSKRDRESSNIDAITQDLTIQIPEEPSKKRGRPRALSSTPRSGIASPASGASPRLVNVDLENLKSTLLSARQNSAFNSKVDNIGPSRMPADVAHDLMITCMQNKKEANLKHMLLSGFRFNFSEELRDYDINAFFQAIVDGKVDFLNLLLDTDPVGATKLLVAAFNAYPNAKVLENLKACLKKSGTTIDSGAIQLAAETAADLQSVAAFKVFFDSELMAIMIPRTKLLKLFSSAAPATKSDSTFRNLLTSINNERRLTSPFEMNLLSQAASEGNMNFLLAVEPFLNIFSWDVVLQAITIALKNDNYNFVDILLRTNIYERADFLFRLVSESVFVETVGKYANYEIIDKLTKATYRDGMNLMVVDLNLMRICMRAAENGNIEVIDYFLANRFFDLSTRFKGKSIFRIALENGRTDLVKFMIKVFGYDIHDSDTPTVNPPENGGDSLIYTARNSHAELFLYLLRLGANPNAKVNHEGSELNLIYWCIMKGQDKIVKHLLDFNCEFDAELAATYNVEPGTMSKIEELLIESQQLKNTKN